MRRIFRRLIPPIAAVLIGTPIYFLFLDREPPFERLDEDHGSELLVLEIYNPRLGRDEPHVAVKYVTTRRTRICLGPNKVQQEFISGRTRLSQESRDATPARWEDHPTNPKWEIFYGHPVLIPPGLHEGRTVTFKTNTFRNCNFMQWLLPYWPIVQDGPDLHFDMTPALFAKIHAPSSRQQDNK